MEDLIVPSDRAHAGIYVPSFAARGHLGTHTHTHTHTQPCPTQAWLILAFLSLALFVVELRQGRSPPPPPPPRRHNCVDSSLAQLVLATYLHVHMPTSSPGPLLTSSLPTQPAFERPSSPILFGHERPKNSENKVKKKKVRRAG